MDDDQSLEREALDFTYLNDISWDISKTSCKIAVEPGSDIFLHLEWPRLYPEVVPMISIFYKDTVFSGEVCDSLMDELQAEARNLLGMPMTISLVEIVKDYAARVRDTSELADTSLWELRDARDNVKRSSSDDDKISKGDVVVDPTNGMTKNQKRKYWDKVNMASGQRVRGYNWVDVVSHVFSSSLTSL